LINTNIDLAALVVIWSTTFIIQ